MAAVLCANGCNAVFKRQQHLDNDIADLYNVRSLMHLLAVMLLGQQLNDGLGQLHLLILLFSQRGPHNRKHQNPQVVCHVGICVGDFPQGRHQVGDLQLPCIIRHSVVKLCMWLLISVVMCHVKTCVGDPW